jgi:two-component system OmpR family response regulator
MGAIGAEVTILVVDDDAEFLSSLGTALDISGYQVIRAFDATQAQTAMHEGHQVDLLIVDIVLPDKSGLELIHTTSRSVSPPKILATSANQSALHLEIATYMGADLAIPKFPQYPGDPFPVIEWNVAIRNTLSLERRIAQK